MTAMSDAVLRSFNREGEVITLRRLGTPAVDLQVRAKARGYRPEELVGGIKQGSREIRILAKDVTFDPALRSGDKVILHGRTLNIEAVDASTGRAGSDLLFYIVQASG